MTDRNSDTNASVQHAGQGVVEASHEQPDCDLAALIQRHEHDIRSCILALVPNWADAEDIFQETCLRLLKQRPQPGGHQNFRSWSVTAAYYQVMTYRKRRGRESNRFSEFAMELIKDRQADTSAERERRLKFLARCVGKLDREAQEVLSLAYGMGHRLQDIAVRLGRTEASTYKLHSRIRMQLRTCVERSLRAES